MTAEVGHHPDSFELLGKLTDGFFDVVITDPPYPKEVQNNLCSGSLVGTKNVPKYELDFAPIDGRRTWLADALRGAKRWVVTFCSVEDFGRYQDIYGKEYVRGGVWAKKNAMGQLTADRPATAYEGVAILHRLTEKKRWNGKGSYGIWSCNGTRGKKDRHPNEKPLNLALKLVALFSDRDEVVFDPFCGSGVIGQACVMLGRHYVGADNDTPWVEKARARVDSTTERMSDEAALQLCRMWGDNADA